MAGVYSRDESVKGRALEKHSYFSALEEEVSLDLE